MFLKCASKLSLNVCAKLWNFDLGISAKKKQNQDWGLQECGNKHRKTNPTKGTNTKVLTGAPV